MFPLGTVLLPGSGIPLHVFEPRYRQMVQDVLAADGPPLFGQVLITHGQETGGDDQRAEVGVEAEMTSIRALDGGRYGFVAVGRRRVRIVEWLPDDPYPRARVEVWDDAANDTPADAAARIATLHDRILEVLVLAQRVQPFEMPPTVDLPDDPSAGSFLLAALAPIGQADRLRMLAAEGVGSRLDGLAEALDDVEAMLQFRLS